MDFTTINSATRENDPHNGPCKNVTQNNGHSKYEIRNNVLPNKGFRNNEIC